MKQLIVLLFMSVAMYANQPCEQMDYRANCPVALDPNVPGAVLGTVPGDPNEWAVVAGPWTRPAGMACDADGDKFEIQCLTPGWIITHDAGAGTWMLAGEVKLGPQVIQVQAIDKWEAIQTILVVIIGVAPEQNTPPVLQ